MQLLIGASHHFFKYNTTTANQDSIENSINALDITFACLAITSLHYGLFGELVKGFSLFSISNTFEDPIVSTYYGQYSELITGFPTFDYDYYNKNAINVYKNNDKRIVDNKEANNKIVDNGAADNNNDQGKNNNQNSNGDYKKEQKILVILKRVFFWIKLDLSPWLHQKRLF